MKQNNLVTTFRDLTSGPCRKVNIVRMILLYVKPIVVTCFYLGKFSIEASLKYLVKAIFLRDF